MIVEKLPKIKYQKGFTLLELLVTIALLGVIAAVILRAINPFTQIAKARDAVRKQDVNALARAIQAYHVENYPALPAAGNTYISTDGSPPENAGGAGWIPSDLSTQVKTLPIDLLNNGAYFYRYYADTVPPPGRFKIDVRMEADFAAAENDGGIDPNRYEVGTDKTLLPP